MPSLRNRKVKGKIDRFLCDGCGRQLVLGETVCFSCAEARWKEWTKSKRGLTWPAKKITRKAISILTESKPTIFEYVKSKCMSCGEKIVGCGVFVGGRGLYFVSLQGLTDDPIESGILKGYCDFEPCYERSKI